MGQRFHAAILFMSAPVCTSRAFSSLKNSTQTLNDSVPKVFFEGFKIKLIFLGLD